MSAPTNGLIILACWLGGLVVGMLAVLTRRPKRK